MSESSSHWDELKREREGSRNEIADALRLLGATVPNSGHLRCPFHDDKHPSATLRQSEGKWFFTCHAATCNVAYDVWDLTGMLEGKTAPQVLKEYKKEVLDEFDKTNPDKGRSGKGTGSGVKDQNKARGKRGFDTAEDCAEWSVRKRNSGGASLSIERYHPYTDPETGIADLYVVRLRDDATGRKSYTQAFRDPDGRWTGSKPPDFGSTPLYNRMRLSGVQNVIMVEGEGCVEAFTRLKMEGWAATTTHGGAGKASLADLSPLAGKTVWLWPDNDEYDDQLKRTPGEHHMQEIADKLLQMDPPVVVRRVRIEDLDLPVKGDIVDFLSGYGSKEEKIAALKCVFQDAEPIGATRGARERLDLIIAGQFEHIDLPESPVLSRLAQPLLPGTVTVICGDPGAAKSFFALEKAWRLHLAGRKVKVLELEEDYEYWQFRAAAQMSGCADLTYLEWIKGHSAKARQLFDAIDPQLDSFSRRLCVAPPRPTMQWCAEWVDEAVDEGNEVIFVDPITAAATSDKVWLDDHEFLFSVKESVKQAGARLVLMTHPKNDVKGKPSLASIAGGAAWPRFSQTVLWLRELDRPQESTIDPGDGNMFEVTHEREIQIRKARSARGSKTNIAYILDKSSLCFVECGEVVRLDN